LLCGDLSYSGIASNGSTHAVHAFAAKFPPALPAAFIEQLSSEGEVVLDPMAGSGTALVEALRLRREAIGFDIDPLALRLSYVKTHAVDEDEALVFAEAIADWARLALDRAALFESRKYFEATFEVTARDFFEYWFEEQTILELAALVQGIRSVAPGHLSKLFEVIFSSLIITKSGGVSRALDLAHTRPHRVATKKYRNAIDAFFIRASKVIPSIAALSLNAASTVAMGDSRSLALGDETVDLIVTSPPYANAIDYMRAHKFSLMWFGAEPASLTERRKKYIGAEVASQETLMKSATGVGTLGAIAQLDRRRADVLRTYFSDMQTAMAEMFRVLRPGRACVIVVGGSTVRGVRLETGVILAEEARAIGFEVTGVAERPIVRNRRMMPVSHVSGRAGIEARMHGENVIGLIKPA
jgi:DNA modification methylase